MAGHKYAQALRWIADGEKVQIKMEEWVTCSAEGAMRHILNDTHHQFRLKPRTLTIAGVEIEAPLKSIEQGQEAWTWDAVGFVVQAKPATFDNSFWSHAIANGRVFATPEAAKAAYDAITALLTGKDAA